MGHKAPFRHQAMRTQSFFHSDAATPYESPAPQGYGRENRLIAAGHDDPWDRNSYSSPNWNGQDFSRCARLKYLVGEPALLLTLILGASFILPVLLHAWHWLHVRRGTSTGGGSWMKTRSHVARKFVTSDLYGPQAVSHAEDLIIAGEVMREGGLGIDEQHRQELLLDFNLSTSSPSTHQLDACSYSTALVRSWKELSLTACTLGLLVVSVVRHLTLSGPDTGSDWLLLPIILWLCVSVISAMKFLIQIRSAIRNKPHPGPQYFQLEYRTVPVYLISLPFELLDTRSVSLQYFGRQPAAEATNQLLAMRLLTVVLLIAANVLELGTARPSSFIIPDPPKQSSSTVAPADVEPDVNSKRPGPLEPGCSLLSLAFFIHTDSYLWRHKSSTATEDSIPDLRADDKCATILFRWKKDQAAYEAENIKPSFLRALCWHLRSIVLSQQLFAYFNAFGSLLPPFFLQRIIGFISSKNGKNPEPMDVALLYAFGMLITQVFLGFSRSAVSDCCFPLFTFYNSVMPHNSPQL
jgi:hypothetical protein